MDGAAALLVRRELDELEERFCCEENSRTGRLKLAEYTKLRVGLLDRLKHVDLGVSGAPAPAPAVDRVAISEQTEARVSEKLKLPEDEAKTLETFVSMFDAAREIGNFDEMRTLFEDQEFEALAQKQEFATAFKHVMEHRKQMLSGKGKTNESAALLSYAVSLTRDMLSMDRKRAQNFAITKARIDLLAANICRLEQRLRMVEPLEQEEATQ